MGASLFGYVIGNATSLVANADAASAQMTSRMETLNQYMRDRELPRSLQVQIRKLFP